MNKIRKLIFWGKLLFGIAWFALLIAVGAWFASVNSSEVALNLFGMAHIPLRLGFLVFACLSIGFVLGVLTLLPFASKSFLRAKKIIKMEREIQALKMLSENDG